jgi:tungstate transport system substrate-binding protein
MLTRRLVLVALLMLGGSVVASAQERVMILATTTSTEQSGLLGWLLPRFEQATGITVRVVAVGTGQALQLAARGDADAVLAHDRAGEDKLVADGWGVDRRDVMYNDFVIVGPRTDPAGVRGERDAPAALARIAAARAPFASRGDDSGTHRRELRLWREAGLDPQAAGSWYRALGQGMGPTLNTAAGMNAYALTDRATWAAFRNRRDLDLLVEGDPRLLNPYGTILVSPERHPHVRAELARAWQDWLTGPAGQAAIAAFRIDGEQVFFPDARKPGT